MTDNPPAMVRIEDALIRAADVSHIKWDRGHSYTKLRITMRDGTVYVVNEWNGSAYDAESRLIASIEHHSAIAGHEV
ncbi:hypothetical protein MOP88_13835 [Sphingomonas sp. WKB10]|nr:hypothetical protein [Sphingomonas sp. WKB10]